MSKRLLVPMLFAAGSVGLVFWLLRAAPRNAPDMTEAQISEENASRPHPNRNQPNNSVELKTPAFPLAEPEENRREASASEAPASYEQALDSRASSIAGRVLWPDGTPAADVEVRASLVNASEKGSRSWSTRSRPDGSFAFEDAFEASYSLLAKGSRSGPSAASSSISFATIRSCSFGVVENVRPGMTGLLIQMQPCLVLRGTVRDNLGLPLDEFSVRMSRIEHTSKNSTTISAFDDFTGKHEYLFTDAGGFFEIEGLSPGVCSISVSAAGYADSHSHELRFPEETSELEFVLGRLASVRGYVVDSKGLPVSDATVRVEEGGDDYIWVGDWDDPDNLVTDQSGAFALDEVDPGTVVLQARSASSGALTETEIIEIAPGESLSDVQLRLRVAGRITVDVVDASGVGEAGYEVSLFCPNEFLIDNSKETDLSGRVVFEGLPSEHYMIMAGPLGDRRKGANGPTGDTGYLLVRFTEIDLEESGDEVVVLEPPELRPVRIAGRVIVNGEPVAGSIVSFVSKSCGFGESEETDREGAYCVILPRPGLYRANVSREIELELLGEVYFVRDVDVPDTREFQLDISFDTGRASGCVRDRLGRPAANVPVQAEVDGDVAMTIWAHTGPDGRFDLCLPVGTYKIVAGRVERMDFIPLAEIAGVSIGASERRSDLDFVLD